MFGLFFPCTVVLVEIHNRFVNQAIKTSLIQRGHLWQRLISIKFLILAVTSPLRSHKIGDREEEERLVKKDVIRMRSCYSGRHVLGGH